MSTTTRGEGVFVVSLRGDLDISTADELLPNLPAPGGDDDLRIVIDLSRIEFIDSSGLNALAVSARTVKADGGWIVVAEPPEHIARTLELVKLGDYVDVEESVAQALRRAQTERHPTTSDDEPR